MTEPTFMTEEGFATVKAMYNLRRILTREGEGYLRDLHTRCGVGLSTQQFNDIVKVLVDQQWCSLKTGALRATIVILNPAYAESHAFHPDEVVADACKESQ